MREKGTAFGWRGQVCLLHQCVWLHVDLRKGKIRETSVKANHDFDFIVTAKCELDDSSSTETVTYCRNILRVDITIVFEFFQSSLHALDEELWVVSIHARLFNSLVHGEVLLQFRSVYVGRECH